MIQYARISIDIVYDTGFVLFSTISTIMICFLFIVMDKQGQVKPLQWKVKKVQKIVLGTRYYFFFKKKYVNVYID